MPNQIPRSAEIIGPGLDDLAVTRPTAFEHANNGVGRYADVFFGWDAQAQLVIRRLARECLAKRIALSSGPELADLARSEFNTDPEAEPTTALGELTVHRPTSAAGPGAIRKGQRLRRKADPTHIPPIPGAQYVVTRDVPVAYNALTISGIPFAAEQAGDAPCAPDLYGFPALVFVDAPFDPTLVVQSYDVGGGATAKPDEFLRAEALAFAVGQYGPTIGSVLAGALRGTGVRHAAIQDVTALADGSGAAYTGVLVADGAWATSSLWRKAVTAQLVDPATGFTGLGPRIAVTSPSNVSVGVSCSVMVADANFLSDVAGLSSSIQAALVAYFDGRPDWYTWRLAGIRAAISKADPRIRTCVTASVFDPATGTPLAEPPATPTATSSGLTASHYYLVGSAVAPTFLSPT